MLPGSRMQLQKHNVSGNYCLQHALRTQTAHLQVSKCRGAASHMQPHVSMAEQLKCDILLSCHTLSKSSLLQIAPESKEAMKFLLADLIMIHVVCSIVDAARHELVWVQAALAKGK